MTDVEYSMQEVGLLSLIAAMYADEIIKNPITEDSIKAVALKAKSNVKVEARSGGAYYSTGRYTVLTKRPVRRNWSFEIG